MNPLRWFARRSANDEPFITRLAGRTIIVHAGFPPDWLEELLKQPGGGGCLRIDVSLQSGSDPTPLERFVHEHILALELPMPILLKVTTESVLIRHLTRNGRAVHPSEINWMLSELETRHHYALLREGGVFRRRPSMPITDNKVDYDV